jgi:hypothetical protein
MNRQPIKKPSIGAGFWTFADLGGRCIGGAEGDRTPDLRIANATLSQLSYGPKGVNSTRHLMRAPGRYEFSTAAGTHMERR